MTDDVSIHDQPWQKFALSGNFLVINCFTLSCMSPKETTAKKSSENVTVN